MGVVKLEDFTRLSLAIPDSAAAAVRVGASCRVNGAPLSVASVKERHDGLGVIASFGVALNSPLTSTLSTMTAGASVRLEVETDAAEEANGLDVVDVATSKRMREMQDGLPGTREWYNQALPWYSKMYPTGFAPEVSRDEEKEARALRRKRDAGNAGTRERGRPFTEDDARLSRELDVAAADAGVDMTPALEDTVADMYGGVIPAPPPSAPERDSEKTTNDARMNDARVAEDPLASASLEVVSALENLARRNSHLTDRVEMLLEMIENKGFGDAEVMDGLKRLEESGKAAERARDEETKAGVNETATETSKETESDVGADAVRENSVEVCVMSHPGALCCTRSEIATDAGKGGATITLHTSVRAVNGAEGKMAPADFVALGARAAESAARALAADRTAEAVRGATTEAQESAHQTITRLLQNGKIVWVESMSEIEGKFGHPCYRLRVECHRGTGAAIEAVFKPKIEGDGDGWHRASMEYVAYKLSRMLGMDLVPPAAYRTGGIELDYKTFDEGAFMYWVDDAKELEQVGDFGAATRDGCWGEGVDPRVVLSDTRVLDVLLQNSDRHSGHFLFGRHWTEGLPADGGAFGALERGGGDGGSNGNANGGDRGSSNGSSNGNANGEGGARDARFGNGTPTLGGARYLPCLIDHAASFRPEAFVSMEHENAFQTGPTVCVKSSTYLRLRFLDAAAIEREFSYFLSADERKMLLERVETILAYLDDLVEKRGYDDVVIR